MDRRANNRQIEFWDQSIYLARPRYYAQQRVCAPLLAEAAAVLGFRAILGTRLGLKLDILGLE